MTAPRRKYPKNWKGPGVGMPASLLLDQFGQYCSAAFTDGDEFACAYLVGSALLGKQWRDIDVRLIISDALWDRMQLGDVRCDHANAKWNALVLAFSTFGRQMTGLPIDFQIQQQSWANATFPKQPRSALFVLARSA